jgi:hypothetical protein
MARFPLANWRPIKRHFRASGMDSDVHGLVVHITDSGDTLASLGAGFDFEDKNGNQHPDHPGLQTSAHFGVAKDGTISQFLDTDDMAFANGNSAGANSQWISVENIAKFPEVLTAQQQASDAALLAWLNDTREVPLRLAESGGERGLGFHFMFDHNPDHPCPGPAVTAQRPDVLRLAVAMRGNSMAGLWEVKIGNPGSFWTWRYRFYRDKTVDYRDLKDPETVKGRGTWDLGRSLSGREVFRVKWPAPGNAPSPSDPVSEEWDWPLKQWDTQKGLNMDDLTFIRATRLEN